MDAKEARAISDRGIKESQKNIDATLTFIYSKIRKAADDGKCVVNIVLTEIGNGTCTDKNRDDINQAIVRLKTEGYTIKVEGVFNNLQISW